MDDELVARSLGALSQVHRLKAFRALVIAGGQGLTPGVLCEQLGISPASMSFHLKALMFAGLVSQSRDGRNLIYRASFDRMNDLLGFLTSNCCEGQPCEGKRRAFELTRQAMGHRMMQLLALPPETMDRAELQAALIEIGWS